MDPDDEGPEAARRIAESHGSVVQASAPSSFEWVFLGSMQRGCCLLCCVAGCAAMQGLPWLNSFEFI